MRRLILAVVLLSLAAVGAAQPPVVPAGGAAPAPQARMPADGPLAGFEPLAAFPPPTQSAVRSVLLGGGWLARVNQAHGRFQYGYNPALRQPLDGDDDGMQARAALALARAARFAGDERQAVVAAQAVLALLALTKASPDGAVRTPHTRAAGGPTDFAATLALAVYELPRADERLLAEAERLCGYLRAGTDPGWPAESAGVAVQAVAASHRARPEAWKAEAMAKAVAHYPAVFKRSPTPQLAAALIPACAEVAGQTRSADAAAAAFEMTDWLLGLQYAATDPRYPLRAGGFKGFANGQPVDAPPTAADTGLDLQAVAAAYQLNRQAADLGRAARYRQAAQDAAQFLTGLQYAEANTRHFENGFRAGVLIGGFYLSPADGNLRIDATAAAVSGLTRFLSCGAER
ncbi:MAG: hypothetical protein K2X87_04300 [Gemmataceae bacterium]|nr:hypothetical protein [Gemmataceae bacterium]